MENSLKTDIQAILNLRTDDSIGAELAERQLEVIYKSYKYLSTPGNNIIYIADEVGLGKTYIAAGIAMLLRHYSKDLINHKDVIIVPKKNLQVKWRKELNNFIQYNYLPANDIIHSQIKDANSIKDRLAIITTEDPISIFRMTSFSALASPRNKKSDLRNYLITEIFEGNPFANSTIQVAWEKGYFNDGYESHLRKLVAYLLNGLSPTINCVIVDEAHNYKHGLGSEEHDGSIRNEITARFLGAINDTRLLNEFPDLKAKVKFPLADKIICLSATPKDRSLIEIKNQFNCFTNKHILNEAKSADDVKGKLKKFLIRGNLEYRIENIPVSRNQCRLEHRLGNINKVMEAKPLVVEDGFECIFWQLLQYKSIKHLNTKNNASFEIGMLAGFESYQLDADKKKSNAIINENENHNSDNKEYDLTSHKIKESQDYNVIKRLVDSYRDNFSNELPPHPKQTKLENEIINQLCGQEKSLIFVRRVATAYELEKRFLLKYEKDIVVDKLLKFSGRYLKYNTAPLQELLKVYNQRHILEKLDGVFTILLSKNEIKEYVASKNFDDNTGEDLQARIWMETAFLSIDEFGKAMKDFVFYKKKNISVQLKEITINALKNSFNQFVSRNREMEDDDTDDSTNEPDSGYFFSNYFKKGKQGFKYRNKMYRETWFEINVLQINNCFRFLNFDTTLLDIEIAGIEYGLAKKKHQLYQRKGEIIHSFLEGNAIIDAQTDIPEVGSESTFLSDLLINHCSEELSEWFKKRIKKPDISKILKDIILLNTLLKGIFRNGSGLLPGFLADSIEMDFSTALQDLLGDPEAPFHFVLTEIRTVIRDFDLLISINFQDRDANRINTVMKGLSPVIGATGQDKRDRGIIASQFRLPGFPYVLVTTDIFREGEDLHTYCQNIYHYGIAWNPSDMEQRTGRIDRINSLSYRKLNQTDRLTFDNKIQVFYPYLSQSVEVNQVIELLKNINKFIETFNEIEIENKYESSVRVDNEITESDIPQQIVEKLKSLYDVDGFDNSTYSKVPILDVA